MRKILSQFFLIILSCVLPLKLFAAQFDKIVMFGDSLSDTGRMYDIFSGAHKVLPIIPVLPKSPPYYNGRFSNGPVWIENLAASLHLNLQNYALGGSLAESFWESGVVFPWSFDTMLDSYLTDNLFDTKKAQHLYVVWGGGNDYLNDRPDVEGATSKTIIAIKRHIDKLASAGATHILVLNLPDLGQAPIARERGPDAAAHMSLLVRQHNAKLQKMVVEAKRKYVGKVDILLADVNYYFEDALINPAKYQLKDVSHACYTGGFTLQMDARSPALTAMKNSLNLDVMNNASLRTVYLMGQSLDTNVCENPDEYLFWDIIHPTRATHRIVAAKVEEALKISGWV